MAGVALGGLIAWLTQRDVANMQLRHQLNRDSAQRLFTLRRTFVEPLQAALGELIDLAVHQVPSLQIPPSEPIPLDPAMWQKDWKIDHEKQGHLREQINRFALMSPFPSTMDHARSCVQKLDKLAIEESKVEALDNSWDTTLTDRDLAQLQDLLAPATEAYKRALEDLLRAAYAFRRHLESLASRPDQEPPPPPPL